MSQVLSGQTYGCVGKTPQTGEGGALQYPTIHHRCTMTPTMKAQSPSCTDIHLPIPICICATLWAKPGSSSDQAQDQQISKYLF